MKKLASILLCIWTLAAHAQNAPAVISKEISETVLQKILGKTLPKAVPIVLSNAQIKTLSTYYPTVKGNTSRKEQYVLVGSDLYLTDMTATELGTWLDNHRILPPNVQAQVDAVRNLSKVTSPPVSKDFYKGITKDMQTLLFYLGYDIKPNGLWGRQTKLAIRDAFGIDCTNLSPMEASKKLHILLRRKPTKQVFDLHVRNSKTGEDVKKLENLSEVTLEKELKEFSCGPDQLCVGLSKLKGSISFKCEGPNGEMDIEISVPGKLSFDMRFNGDNGGSTKLSLDSDGKIKFTTTKDGKLQGVTN